MIMSRGNIRIHSSIVLCGVSLSVKLSPGRAAPRLRLGATQVPPRTLRARDPPSIDKQLTLAEAPRRASALSSTLSACVWAGFVFARARDLTSASSGLDRTTPG